MSRSAAARCFGAALLIAGAACSQTPTAPTPVSSGASIGQIAQEPPPVPPRLGPVLNPPPDAIGATRFLAFGDSITEGVFSLFDGMFLYPASSHAYPDRLQAALNAHHRPVPFTVVNRGVAGETADTGQGRLPGVMSQHRPQVLLLLEGINDMNGGTSATRAASSVANMVNMARLYNATVLVATMFQTEGVERPDGQFRENSAELIVPFNTELKRLVAGLQNVHVVDLHAAMGSNLIARGLLGNDGLHPTAAGYQLMAQVFEQRIEQIFPVRGGVQ